MKIIEKIKDIFLKKEHEWCYDNYALKKHIRIKGKIDEVTNDVWGVKNWKDLVKMIKYIEKYRHDEFKDYILISGFTIKNDKVKKVFFNTLKTDEKSSRRTFKDEIYIN